MERLAAFLLLSALVVLASADAHQSRRLLASATAGSSSSATSKGSNNGNVKATSVATSKGGSSFASSTASSEVLEQVEDIFAELFATVVSDTEGMQCEDVLSTVSLEVEAKGTAVASVYAGAFGEVRVEGDGKACADAAASGEAFAEAFATTIAGIVLGDKAQEEKDESFDAVAEIVSGGVAKAFANAFASVCTTEGFGVAEQSSFAEAVVSPVARAFIFAIAGTECLDKYDEIIESGTESFSEASQTTSSESNTIIEGQGSAEAAGVAGGSTSSSKGEESSAESDTSAVSVSDNGNGLAEAGANADSSEGSSTASSFATAEVFEQVEEIVQKAFVDIKARYEGKDCDDVLESIFIEAAAHATAVASVYSSAFGQVEVVGDGTACADASSSGTAEAAAFAQAVVGVLSKSGANADVIEEIVSTGTAQAFAEAYASVCTTGGYGLAEQTSFAEAVTSALARAFLFATAGADCLDKAAGSEASGEQSVFSDTMSTTVVDGEGSADAFGQAEASTQGGAEPDSSAATDSLASSLSDNMQGSADATAAATSTEGFASATAIASAEVYTEVTNDIASILMETAFDGKACGDILDEISPRVEAAATAFASVYTAALGEVVVDGEGEACAESSAAAQAEARAVAAILAASIAEYAQTDSDSTAKDIEDIIAAGSAKAFADAFATACTTDGFALAEQTAFAEAITSPIVEAIAFAVGGNPCKELATSRDAESGDSVIAESESNTVVEGEGTAEVDGNAGASTEQITDPDAVNAEIIASVTNKCSREFRLCCSRSLLDSDECKCSMSSNPRFHRCDAKSIRSEMTDEFVWRNSDDFMCKC